MSAISDTKFPVQNLAAIFPTARKKCRKMPKDAEECRKIHKLISIKSSASSLPLIFPPLAVTAITAVTADAMLLITVVNIKSHPSLCLPPQQTRV